ncbi:hypothetical protein LINGRAHAP2_LOCUS11445, partial [Linum grandiflorum]
MLKSLLMGSLKVQHSSSAHLTKAQFSVGHSPTLGFTLRKRTRSSFTLMEKCSRRLDVSMQKRKEDPGRIT